MTTPGQFGIDFVILWVDGSDPEFTAAHSTALAEERAAGRPLSDTPNRHRDNGELLFLLRAIEQNMPWYRRIYIVTNGQRPRYVDFTSDRIRLVTHRQIFPADVQTPSFNTFGIESCIHHIEGLSEVFVRFSDDFFPGKPVSRQQFLGPDGFGHALFGEAIFNVGPGTYQQQLENAALRFHKDFALLPMHNYCHAPQLRHIRMMQRLVAHWPDWYAATRANRFRTASDANTLLLYPYFALFQHRPADLHRFLRRGSAPGMTQVFSPPHDKEGLFAWVQAGGRKDWRMAMKQLVATPPRFFNINDDLGISPDPADVAFIGAQLRKLFPKPSPYEDKSAPPPPFAA